MKREIKFRALKDDVSNCIFKYGQLVYDAIGQPRITEVDSSGEGLTFHTCIRGTESQFTGLLDKNEKEIYEGDVVNYWTSVRKTHVVAAIKYEIQACAYWLKWSEDDERGKKINRYSELRANFGSDIFLSDSIEIIGNKYENPELAVIGSAFILKPNYS